jgi:hypothetical protein
MRTYTFHVSLPGYGRVWRKLELPEAATLEQLHEAIQGAYQFDNDHLYSFFMSGQAWDSATEYNLPEDAIDFGFFGDEEDEEDEEFEGDEEFEDDEEDEEAKGAAGGLFGLANPMTLFPGEEVEKPTPEQLRAMFTQLEQDPQAREQFMQAVSQQLGLPPLMAQMMMGNLTTLFSSMTDEQLQAILNTGPGDLNAMMGGDSPFGDEEAAGDVRSTTLADLGLQKGQKFLYLFDYGDEWRFQVKVDAINADADATIEYPRLVQSVGEAPEQYPDWEEDDDEAWEDDDE